MRYPVHVGDRQARVVEGGLDDGRLQFTSPDRKLPGRRRSLSYPHDGRSPTQVSVPSHSIVPSDGGGGRVAATTCRRSAERELLESPDGLVGVLAPPLGIVDELHL